MNKKGNIILYICLFAVLAYASGLLWQYSLGTWLHYFHKPNNLKFWQCMVMGFVPWIGQESLPLAFVTWVLMMFIGGQ